MLAYRVHGISNNKQTIRYSDIKEAVYAIKKPTFRELPADVLTQFTVPGVNIDLVNGVILTPPVELVEFVREAKNITDGELQEQLGSRKEDKIKEMASEIVAEMYTQYVHEALKKTVDVAVEAADAAADAALRSGSTPVSVDVAADAADGARE